MKNQKSKNRKPNRNQKNSKNQRAPLFKRAGSPTLNEKRKKTGGVLPSRLRRPMIPRLKKILEMLQEGKYPNCTMIAKALEVSPKTAIRDIDVMRESLELPIAYDDQRHGFYLTKPVERFPMVPVTERELFYVCVAHKAIEHYRGTPLEKPLEQAFKKFAARLDDGDQMYFQSMDEVLSIRPFAPDDADLQRFEIVTQGITERRLMKFRYRKPGEQASRGRRVHPYHLLEFGSRWYLIAFDLDKKVVRKYVLGRMRDLVLTNQRFTDRMDFDPKTYFSRSVGVITGEGDYEVVIEMDAWLTDILRGRRFHPKQIWTELPGGGSRLKLRLDSLAEIEQHVLSWGTHANVSGPAELRQRLFHTAEQLWQRYGGPMVLHEGRAGK